MTLTCGIDVGGTKIAGAVVDDRRARSSRSTGSSRRPPTSRRSRTRSPAWSPSLGSRHRIERGGRGRRRLRRRRRSMVMFAPNLAWRDVDLEVELEERVDLPVIVENDANAAAWGEFRFGAGEDVDDLLMVTVGTGVGGGIVLDGELLRGCVRGRRRDRPPARRAGWSACAAAATAAASSSTAAARALVKAARDAARPCPRRRLCLAAAGGDPEAITGPMITDARAGRRRVREGRGSPRSVAGSARASPRWSRCSTRPWS